LDTLTFLERAQDAYRSADYQKALDVICDAEVAGKASVELLLLKGACIQLATGTDYALSRALQVYISLLERRPHDPRVLAEAGFYCLNVGNESAQAVDYLGKSVNAYAELILEVLVGLTKASVEVGISKEQALSNAQSKLQSIGALVEERLRREQ
jgi:hypothetical protein